MALRLEADRMVIQWRLSRKTDLVGAEIRSDEEFEDVREVAVPLSGLAGGTVRRRWWHWIAGPRIVLTAADLQAFEAVAGEEGLRLGHPAEIILRLRRSDVLAAEEFAAELTLAVAQRALASDHDRSGLGDIDADSTHRLPDSGANA